MAEIVEGSADGSKDGAGYALAAHTKRPVLIAPQRPS
jgi:hypothetical protein